MGHLNGASIDMQVVMAFVISGFAGVFLGARLAKVIPPGQLRTSFAVFVVILGSALLFDNVSKLL
jgi:uncharacterized membrane protein YfcA